MTTGNQAPDLAERGRALDPERSFIVQAPAGSGKTELLIQRFLRLLSRVDNPEEIVAVTFTRKAAGEMRERVLSALAAARAGQVPASPHEALTLRLAEEALARDAACEWNVADNPARLRVQTIDSLCASLTRQMPMLSSFGAQPEIVDDAAALHREAARATVELVERDDEVGQGVARDMERLLGHLDNDVERIEALLAAMLGRRDQWMRRVYRCERAPLEAALQRERRAALVRVDALFPATLREEVAALARYAATHLDAAGDKSYLYDLKELTSFPGVADTDVAAWRGLNELWLTGKGEWRRRLTVKEGFPAGGSKAEKAVASGWKDRGLAVLASLQNHASLASALEAVAKLPPPAYPDAQWEVLESILRLLPVAAGQLKLVFQSRGQVDFTEVAQGALRALGERDAPTDLALALDYRVRHLLIDEFQDTSISQYELVERLTAGWSEGDGRTVFAVGDPMQSIYRFREAEVGLFLRARAEGIGDVRLDAIALSANFRSRPGVVEWVNGAFGPLMPPREDVATGAVPYTASVPVRAAREGTAVTVHPLFDDRGAGEAAKVVELVEASRRAAPEARIAILVRSRGQLREIVPQLRRAGLRFRAIEIEPLAERPVVQDLLSLTRALSHVGDRLSWLSVLRAPWCGLVLHDLHAVAGDTTVTILEALHDETRLAAVSPDGRERIARLRGVLDPVLAQRSRGSLRERVAGAWYALGGPACVAATTDLEDAEIYFDYLGGHEEAGEIADPAAFDEGLAKLHALPDVEADGTLEIMTVHKSKGLEFDTVILPGLGRLPRSDERRLMLWTEQPGEHAGTAPDLLFAPIQETGADGDPIYAWLQRLEGEKARHEDGRLLYVAATRAREQLHLIGSVRLDAADGAAPQPCPPPKRSLLGRLWPAVEPEFARAAALTEGAVAALAAGQVTDRALRRLPSGWRLPDAPPAACWDAPRDATRSQDEIEFSWAGETARHVGTVVHRWLQRIAEDALEGWDARRVAALRAVHRRELAARGVAEADLDVATERVTAALARAVTEARGRWLLGPQRDAYTERRVTAVRGGERVRLVVDRMFRDSDGTPWIVDYKTSSHEGAGLEAFLDSERQRYRAQLERYAAALSSDGTTLGLYFPLIGGWRDWRRGDA